jgi:DNA-binding NtrC family response regulator
VPALARHFLARAAAEQGAPPRALTPAAETRLAGFPWPGNIRELENVLRSLSLFCDAEVIDTTHLDAYLPTSPAPLTVRAAAAPPGEPGNLSDIYPRAQAAGLSLRELKRQIERECITRALGEAGGNITRAAELLRMKRPRLSQLLKEHGITMRAGSEVN